MRIQEIAGYHVRIPLKRRVKHASHSRIETDSFVVRCQLDDGTEGWGEGLPRDYVTGETIATVLEQFRATDWPRQLGSRIDSLSDAVAVCDRILLAFPSGQGSRDCFGNSLRCAVEIAVLDAVARHFRQPFSEVTSILPEAAAIEARTPRARYSAAITSMGALREMIHALKVWYYEFHQGKMKVGVSGVDDAAALRRIRWVLGPQFDLRVDANEAWTCRDLEKRIEPLLALGITSLEQPVPHAEVDGLARFRGKIGIPLMLDESLCSVSDAERAVERGTCDLFNIRLSKCGGFLSSLRVAALANRAGLGYQLGCQVGETGILSAAGRHFATSIAGIRYLEGSFDRFLVTERLTQEDITFNRGGWAPALAGVGLGVEIDKTALQRVSICQDLRRVA